MTKTNRFESCLYLVDFAKAETTEVKTAIEEFFTQKDLTVAVIDLDPDTGYNVGKVRFIGSLPSEWRGKVSNIIKNLRDALDQATYAASAVVRGQPSNRTHFPFGESPDDLEYSLSRRKAVPCQGIPDQLFPLFRSFEPYPTGDGYKGGNNNLRLLGRVSGPHKHSVTLKVTGAMELSGIGPGVMRVGSGGATLTIPPRWDSENNELTIVRFPPGGHFEMDCQITLGVTFGEGFLLDVEVLPYLECIGETVGTIVNSLAEF